MKLTTKGRYAVIAMVELAATSRGKPVALAEIADRQDISLSYLEQLFAKLRRNGLVRSVRGPGGGYILATSPDEISVSSIILAVDDQILVPPLARRNRSEAGTDSYTLAQNLWRELSGRLKHYLDSVSIEDVLNGQLSGPHEFGMDDIMVHRDAGGGPVARTAPIQNAG